MALRPSTTGLLAWLLFFFFFLVAILSPASSGNFLPSVHHVEAIYSFGDSLADTGNLIREGNLGAFGPITHLPYGKTTFGKATGRCSDGLLMVDYLATAFHLPLLNPYLEKDANFDHGVNFAVAGATALHASFFREKQVAMPPFTNSSLAVQLGWFKAHINSTCGSPLDCTDTLTRSLFIVGEIGGNDYNYALFAGKSLQEVEAYVPKVVGRIVNAAKELIDLGATRLVVPGNFPIGCLPSYLSVFHSSNASAYDENKCLKSLNEFALHGHNEHLLKALTKLAEERPLARIFYADYYNAFMHILSNAAFLGFDESSLLRACCGGGGEYNFNMLKMCGTPGATTCKHPQSQIHWDGVHLTQEAYKFMFQELTVGGYTHPVWPN